jgi:hypothetical protein
MLLKNNQFGWGELKKNKKLPPQGTASLAQFEKRKIENE